MSYLGIVGKPIIGQFPAHFLSYAGNGCPQDGMGSLPPCNQDNLMDQYHQGGPPMPMQVPGNYNGPIYRAGQPQTIDDRSQMPVPQAAISSSSRPTLSLGDETVQAPNALHRGFNPTEVQPWDDGRFTLVQKLQDATRNRGEVNLVYDGRDNVHIAVKRMPNSWIGRSHPEFVIDHPGETELPWQDIGCVRWLNRCGYQYACALLGVFRDADFTYVATSFASEGDLFAWCEGGVDPGLQREVEVRPYVRQIFDAVCQLHNFGIVHRDLSLENILLTKMPSGEMRVQLIDFSMASTSRNFRNSVRGKASYQAPELHSDEEIDAYLADTFSLGVIVYAMLFRDYPWLSTRPSGCKCFEYVRSKGLPAYLAKRKVRGSQDKVVQLSSPPAIELLDGLLRVDPEQRLVLGEAVWNGSRRSVWDTSWVQDA
mmetsp:Transcript_61479/g.129728  ORF Transcript_61479/g.129728 Transcript_61479/m.129728 type:complete len:426 (+) Transcript_61479:3-1280(+)